MVLLLPADAYSCRSTPKWAPKMFRSPQAEANRVRTSPHILHLCVGFLFFILYPAASVLPPSRLFHHPLFDITLTYNLSHTTSTHNFVTHTPSFTHNFVTHHLSHTTFTHTLFHTQLYHIPSFTHNFVTDHLSNTTLSHTIFHTQLCHTHTNFHTQLCHTPCSHTQFCHTHTPTFTHNFVIRHVYTHNFITHLLRNILSNY